MCVGSGASRLVSQFFQYSEPCDVQPSSGVLVQRAAGRRCLREQSLF